MFVETNVELRNPRGSDYRNGIEMLSILRYVLIFSYRFVEEILLFFSLSPPRRIRAIKLEHEIHLVASNVRFYLTARRVI